MTFGLLTSITNNLINCDIRNEKGYYAKEHVELFVEMRDRDDSAIVPGEFWHYGGLLWMQVDQLIQMNQQSIGPLLWYMKDVL